MHAQALASLYTNTKKKRIWDREISLLSTAANLPSLNHPYHVR